MSLYFELEIELYHASLLQVQRKNTTDKIQQEYEETVYCFEIGHKVSNIVTDNAANMVTTFNASISGFEMESAGSADESTDYVNKLCEDTESSGAYCLDHFETLPKHTVCLPTDCSLSCGMSL